MSEMNESYKLLFGIYDVNDRTIELKKFSYIF